ncbi:S41 family peptidase [Leptobacterium sp. I13]|uniref:S41 family peptidase n=1 Tax=Leptobacterium meishanense TaxID=3128904 RepID=UPI0030EE6782
MKKLILLILFIGFSVSFFTTNSYGQEINKKEIKVTIDSISKQLIEGYIYEDKGKEIATSLKKLYKKGIFDTVQSKKSFSKALTKTLFDLSNDRHLYVRFTEGEAPGANRRRVVRMVPGGTTPEGQTPNAERRVVRRTPQQRGVPNVNNYGFDHVEILPNNIGYLKFSMFSSEPEAIKKADAAMAFLSDVDALIIDLRGNFGGSPEMVLHLSSYLFNAPTHLSTSYRRGWDAPQERWTLENISGKTLVDIPVYILTSKRTFSAAESFTFGLNNNNRVTIVGENTGGGGHFGGMVPVGESLQMFLPQGRVWNPSTGKGFQSTGIEPHHKVPAEEALEKALDLINNN